MQKLRLKIRFGWTWEGVDRETSESIPGGRAGTGPKGGEIG